MSLSFHIVLTGRLLPGAESAFVWDDVADRFNLDATAFESSQVPRLPCVIKRVAGAEEGARYIKALTQAGAEAWSVHEHTEDLWCIVGAKGVRRGPVGRAFLKRALDEGLLSAQDQVTPSDRDAPVALGDLMGAETASSEDSDPTPKVPWVNPDITTENQQIKPGRTRSRSLAAGLIAAALVIGLCIGVLGGQYWLVPESEDLQPEGELLSNAERILDDRGFFGVPLTATNGRGACISSLTYRSGSVIETNAERSTSVISAEYRVWREPAGSLLVQVRPETGGSPYYRINDQGDVILLNVHEVVAGIMSQAGGRDRDILQTLRRVPAEQVISRCGMTGPLLPALASKWDALEQEQVAEVQEAHRDHLVRDQQQRYTFEGVMSCDDVRFAYVSNYRQAGAGAHVVPAGFRAPAGTPVMFHGAVIDWVGDETENLFLVHMKVDEHEYVARISGNHYQSAVQNGWLQGSAFDRGEFCGVGVMEDPQPSLFHNGDLVLPVVVGQAPFQFQRPEELARN